MNRQLRFFLSNQSDFYWRFLSNHPCEACRTKVDTVGRADILVLLPIRGQTHPLFPLNVKPPDGFSQTPFVRWDVPFCFQSAQCFYTERMLDFVSAFSVTVGTMWDFWSLFYQYQRSAIFIFWIWNKVTPKNPTNITATGFLILSPACLLEINHTWSWRIVLFLCFWTQFVSLFGGFLHLYLSGLLFSHSAVSNSLWLHGL